MINLKLFFNLLFLASVSQLLVAQQIPQQIWREPAEKGLEL